MTEDEHSIKAYFQKFANANLADPEIREVLLDYFIDKIYVYDDHLEITGWYSEDRRRVEWTEFKDGEIEFNVFASRGTKNGPHLRMWAIFAIRMGGFRRYQRTERRAFFALPGQLVGHHIGGVLGHAAHGLNGVLGGLLDALFVFHHRRAHSGPGHHAQADSF